MNRLLAVDKPPTCAGEWLMPPGETIQREHDQHMATCAICRHEPHTPYFNRLTQSWHCEEDGHTWPCMEAAE